MNAIAAIVGASRNGDHEPPTEGGNVQPNGSLDPSSGAVNLERGPLPRVPRQRHRPRVDRGLPPDEELAKLARRERQEFDCATWLHKARELPKEEFQREVEKELNGKETEPWEILYFKLYKSQIPVIEQAIETAALMLGSDKSRGYCLEMICADFLAGANLDNGDPDVVLRSTLRLFTFLSEEHKQAFLERVAQVAEIA